MKNLPCSLYIHKVRTGFLHHWTSCDCYISGQPDWPYRTIFVEIPPPGLVSHQINANNCQTHWLILLMRHSLPNKSFRTCFVSSSCWGKISIECQKKLGIVLFWRSFAMCSVQKTHATLNQSNVKLTAKWILATRVFPRFLPIFVLNSDWLLVVFTFQLIGCYDYVYFYLDLRHTLNRNAISAVFS